MLDGLTRRNNVEACGCVLLWLLLERIDRDIVAEKDNTLLICRLADEQLIRQFAEE